MTHRIGASAALLALGLVVAPGRGHADSCARRMTTTGAATAGATLATAPALVPGRATRLRLVPMPAVHFPAPPGKYDAAAFGGLATVEVPATGTIRASLGGRAWIDVVDGTTALASTAHAHGAPCSGVAKTVDFPLTAGRHVIEISGSEAPLIDLRLAPSP